MESNFRRRAARSAEGGRYPTHRETSRFSVGADSARGCLRYVLAAALATALTQGVAAQTADAAAIAQELQRQIERDRALREQLEPAPDVRLPGPAATASGRLPAAETPCFPIREIVFKRDVPDFDWARTAADPADDPASCGGTGAKDCTQVEFPVPSGPPGTPEGNAKLIEYVGGKRVGDIQTNQPTGVQQ